jgi:hypothetical protein
LRSTGGEFNSTELQARLSLLLRARLDVPDAIAKWRLSRRNETQFGGCIAIFGVPVAFIPRLLSAGRDHYFLLGPRGTGKTSWCRHQYPDALRIDLLNPAVLRRYAAAPEYLVKVVGERRSSCTLIWPWS